MDNKLFKVVIDRPLGSCHPKFKDMIYPINYGFVPNVFAPDNDEQDIYLLGVNVAVSEYLVKKIAIVHRNDDIEEKWIVCPENTTFTKQEIETQIKFQEQYFDSYIEML